MAIPTGVAAAYAARVMHGCVALLDAHLLTDALDVLGSNARLVGHVRSFHVAEDAVHTGSSAG